MRQLPEFELSTRNRVGATVTVSDEIDIRLDVERRLYIIPHGTAGFTSIGFDVAEARRVAVLRWAGKEPRFVIVGTREAYRDYAKAMRVGAAYAARTGLRCQIELTPQFIGLESKRVEVVDSYGERRKFRVGRSSGWLPCHLEITTARAKTGGPVTGAPFRTVKVIG